MRVLLRDLAPGQEYAIQFRSNNGEQISEWSQVTRFTTTNDIVAPATPTNLSWYNSGPAFIAQWDAVTTNSDGTELKDFRHYRVVVTDGISDEEFIATGTRFEFTKEMNGAAFGAFKSALEISVYAVDNTYNESEPANKSVDPEAPPVPTAPVLSAYYGSILLEWNGRDTDGAQMPSNVDFVEIHIGPDSDFEVTAETYFDRIILNRSSATQRAILAGLDNGETYYAKLVVVDILQKRSNPSVASNATTKTNLTGLEIEDGQIGKNQINFTARDIGGANAYFVEDVAERDAIEDAVSGDIVYITGAGYDTYRYNGTTWVDAPEVGVISGTKILAGTVTADAVGTNLIISAKANIGEAIIDSSHIDQLNANVIKAGSLESQFTVNYAGEAQPRPAWKLDVQGNLLINNAEIKGQLVIGDANNTTDQNANFAIRSFNYVPGLQGWTINGDGTVEFASGTFRGTLRTAASGGRVVIGTSTNAFGTLGSIDLYDFNNRRVMFTTATQQTQDPSGNPTWMLGFDDLFSVEGNGGPPPNTIHMVKNGALTLNSGGPVNIAAANSFRVSSSYFGSANILSWAAGSGSTFYGPQSTHRMHLDSAGNFFFYTPGNSGTVRVANYGSTNASPGIQQYAASGHGNRFHVYQDGRGVWGEYQWWNGGGWSGIRASAFEVASDMRIKEDVVTAETAPMLDAVKKTRVTKYKLKPRDEVLKVRPKKGRRLAATAVEGEATEVVYEEVAEPAPVEEQPTVIGLIGQEAPKQIVNIADDGSHFGIELYQMTTMVWGAVQELTKIVEALTARVAALEPKGKNK